MTNEDTTKIREQNDLVRKQIFVSAIFRSVPCTVVHTEGIEAYPDLQREEIYNRVHLFNDFSEDNDPYQEHDFGAFDFEGQKIFWKIDYYSDKNCEWGSENPADLTKTFRVLTIMLASEY